MLELQNKTKELLENGTINLMIGYGAGYTGKPKPVFISNPALASKLIFDDNCTQNLAVYLHKHEVKAYGKLGIVANLQTLRSMMQIAAENQLKDNQLTVLTSVAGKLLVLNNFSEIEDFILKNFPEPLADDKSKIKDLLNMPREERWNYWVKELGSCIKCYACRAACPLCYCTKCTVEGNQPQWIPIASTTQGNLEWHIIRAMHLAGRCIECNECAKACPVDIPINLLTLKLEEDVEKAFSQKPGMKATLDFALSSYKADDKESFIR